MVIDGEHTLSVDQDQCKFGIFAASYAHVHSQLLEAIHLYPFSFHQHYFYTDYNYLHQSMEALVLRSNQCYIQQTFTVEPILYYQWL
jgi:hypothetical protein